MKHFENIRFHGTFRDYQQRVLNSANKHLADGRINIVAAPGSGKTVLGLELIRRLGAPCIILSPTMAIRQQWGARLRDLFLSDKHEYESVFSNDLHKVRLINSITYQALYTAMEKVSCDDNGDSDCSDIDLMETMKAHGIRTICLDEAHHLKNEWQKALEKFIGILGRDVTIISLTATPPYDSEGNEWDRYVKICGQIDEEIFVPELVGQNTLCPHQDYVYFNYPTQAETGVLHTQKTNALTAIDEISKLPFLSVLCDELNHTKDYAALFESAKEYIALITFLQHCGFEISPRLIRELTTKRQLPRFSLSFAETAVQFLLDGTLLTEEQNKEIVSILKHNSVYERRKVSFLLNDRLKRTLVSSVGKLDSIQKITASEFTALGSSLRMLILTDYIKKENVAKIATEETFQSVNIVSIFETLRRSNASLRIGVLSGSLVILPEDTDLSAVKHKKTPIPGTAYCTVEFSGGNVNSVNFVGTLFESGKLQVLVGTKSLLGEGWDSPCINSLILASFVGSFVLSNQMRGRAIRIDKNNPGKISNIWHLVTVEPDHLFTDSMLARAYAYAQQDRSDLVSYDFEVLKRRFDSFMGPNYTTGVIESGIERITAIQPPFDRQGIQRINSTMIALSSARGDVAQKWHNEVADGHFAVALETDIPRENRVPPFVFTNFLLIIILNLMARVVGESIGQSLASLFDSFGMHTILFWLLDILVLFISFHLVKKITLHFNTARSIKTLGIAVYKTLVECGLVAASAKVECKTHKTLCYVGLYLRNASVHDQNIFNTAMTELLSPIENPRYILIRKNFLNRYNYKNSFACPSVIGKKKEYVEVLAKRLRFSAGKFEPVFTLKEGGRKLILKCRKSAYISRNAILMDSKYRVSHLQ